jgi:oxalate decarboxylase/phosphoglucose isomerase-like protein (cupin superfamily)
LNPQEVPEDISLFAMNPNKYPLLNEVSSYVQTSELAKGDCLYIPNFYFHQYVSNSGDAIFLGFAYESSSKLSELFINAIHNGVLDKK